MSLSNRFKFISRGIPLSDQSNLGRIHSVFYELEYPVDFLIVIMWLAACIATIYLPILSLILIRVVLFLPVAFFIPGYCLVVALFPKKGDISFLKRVMYSIGFSIVVLTLTVIGLYFIRWEIRSDTIVVLLTLFTLVIINIAYIRRALLPHANRFRIPFPPVAGSIRPKSIRINQILTVILTLAVIATILATVYIIAIPKEGERFTEFFILGEKQMAADYPYQIITGQIYPMFIGVGNHENQDIAYTIETWLVKTEFDEKTNTTLIMTMEPNDHISFILKDNETLIIPYNLSLKITGYDRIEFLLFNKTVPNLEITGSDRINASYRDLHLIITSQDSQNEEPPNDEDIEDTNSTSD